MVTTTTTIGHYHHHSHHHLSLSSSQPPLSVTIIITTTTICHYHYHNHHYLSHHHHNHHQTYSDIPEDFWKIFQSNMKYTNMKFSGYDNRESIREEVVKNVRNSDEIFGIFSEDLSLMTILSGFKPTFKRFLMKFENLVPRSMLVPNRITKGKRPIQSASITLIYYLPNSYYQLFQLSTLSNSAW